MTATLIAAVQETALQAQVSSLPLRQDDPVSWALMIKVLLITVILLAMTYAGLRWYARRPSHGNQTAMRTDLQCTAVLRLSPRTKVYLVRSDKSELLITESPTGNTVTLLSGGAPSPQSSPAKAKSR